MTKAAQDFLWDIREKSKNQNDSGWKAKSRRTSSELMFVGVHVRRTDYSVWLERRLHGQLVSKRFFVRYRYPLN